MSLTISYQDKPSLTIYANLYSSTDKSLAFNPLTNAFDSFILSSESLYAISLSEDSERVGYYSYVINDTANIPPTENGDFYLLEVRRQQSSSPNRSVDKLTGTMAFYWDGEQEVDICGCQSTSGTTLTAQDVWEYADRTLTQDINCPDVYVDIPYGAIPDCPDPYIIIDNNIEGIEDILSEVHGNTEKLNQIISLIQNININPSPSSSRNNLPNVTNPRITGRNNDASSGINVGNNNG